MLRNVFILSIIVLLSTGCLKSDDPGIPADVRKTLSKAGLNKPELMKVILAFNNDNEKAERDYAYFILGNLCSNYTICMYAADSSGDKTTIDFNKFQDYPEIRRYIDSLENTTNRIFYVVDTITLDVNSLGSKFLINHIANINKIIVQSPWYNKFDSRTLFPYVIPYRVGNEPPCSDILYLHDKYKHLIDSSIITTANTVNDYINSIFSYDERLEVIPDVHSVMTTDSLKAGNRLSIATYKVMVLRSIGVPAAMDYTPYYADSVLSNYTATVFLPDNSELHLCNGVGIKDYPVSMTPKVYRRSFVTDTSSLFGKKDISSHTPRFLGNYNYLDVTNHYFNTEDITVNVPADSTKYVYLAVLNDKEYKAVHWSEPDSSGHVVFTNMVPDINYYPVTQVNDTIQLIPQKKY